MRSSARQFVVLAALFALLSAVMGSQAAASVSQPVTKAAKKTRLCRRGEKPRKTGKHQCTKVPATAIRPSGRQEQGGPNDVPALGDGLGAGPGGRELGAIQWATSKLGSSAYNWYCERFAENAYGTTSRFASALAAQRNLPLHSGIGPAGTLVFFRAHWSNGGYGHVGISLGDGRMISGLQTVRVDSITGNAYWRSLYAGWAYAPGGWPGRAPTGPAPDTGTPPPPPFTTSLDAQFPADSANQVYVTQGGPAVGIGWNVRFNQPFSVQNFVMRPATQDTINRFVSIKADFPGAAAPNDGQVGYYRGTVSAPDSTPAGSYFVQWTVINKATGQAGIQPSFWLVVQPKPAPPAQPCPPPAPGGPYQLTPDSAFTATLDAQFPADAQGIVHVSPGDTVPFGYNVRFNQAFNPGTFALRTDTPGYINTFSSAKGDWYGTTAPNDGHVGYYRANLTVPACTPPGDYFMRWNVINMQTKKWAGLQPSFVLRVP